MASETAGVSDPRQNSFAQTLLWGGDELHVGSCLEFQALEETFSPRRAMFWMQRFSHSGYPLVKHLCAYGPRINSFTKLIY
jgi:hypothetical protein